jgi:hypothetical protein
MAVVGVGFSTDYNVFKRWNTEPGLNPWEIFAKVGCIPP